MTLVPRGRADKANTCGQLVAGMRATIRDPETGAEVPAGAQGEIWVAGPLITRLVQRARAIVLKNHGRIH